MSTERLRCLEMTCAEARVDETREPSPAVPLRNLAAFHREWEAQCGGSLGISIFTPETKNECQVKGRILKIHDVAFIFLRGASVIRTAGNPDCVEDLVGMRVVRRDAWTPRGECDRDKSTVDAGQLLLRLFRPGRAPRFEAASSSAANIIYLPSSALADQKAGAGSARLVRLLLTRARTTRRLVNSLGQIGVRASGTLRANRSEQLR